MKYIKTYEGVNQKWSPFYDKITTLFKIIGYSCYRFPSMSNNPMRINFNLISKPGSISYCLIQELIEEYNDKAIQTLYEDPKNVLYPKDENTTLTDKSYPMTEPEETYNNILNDVLEELPKYYKIHVSTGLNTLIKYIINLQIEVLQANLDYEKPITISDNIIQELIKYIEKYSKPNKLVHDMQSIPLLYNEVTKIYGEKNSNNAIKLYAKGFDD